MKKTKLINLYYIFLATLVVTKIVATVYSGSTVVDHGKKIAQLESQKQELAHKQAVARREIAQNKSLYNLTAVLEQNNFESIKNPLVVTVDGSLASAL